MARQEHHAIRLRIPRTLLWAILATALGLLLLPFVPLVLWSFAKGWFFPALLPAAWTLRGWQYIGDPVSQVPSALRQTILVAALVTVLALIVALPAGRALGQHRFRGKGLVEFLILAPTIVPGLASAIGLHVVFVLLGLADTLFGVVLVHLIPAAPYAVLILAGAFANYDTNYEAQARTLGAGPLRTFWYVTLPALGPSLVVAGLFAFLISWSQYGLTLLIGGGQVVTLALLLFAFASGSDQTITAALALVFVAPVMLLLLLTARFLGQNSAALGGMTKL